MASPVVTKSAAAAVRWPTRDGDEQTQIMLHPPMSVIIDPHYSVGFYAELWGFSEDTVQRWFEEETGVLKTGSEGGRGKRRRITLRIPLSVAMRIYRERTK